MRNLLVCLLGLVLLISCDKEDAQIKDDIYYQKFDVDFPNYKNEKLSYDIDGDGKDDFQLEKTVELKELNDEFVIKLQHKTIRLQQRVEFLPFGKTGIVRKDQKIEPGLYDEWNESKDKFDCWMPAGIRINYSHKGVSEDKTIEDISKFYWGIKLVKDGKVYYGWLLLNPFDIEELAINMKPNSLIKVGQTE